jgi:Cu+-exporting ATPase
MFLPFPALHDPWVQLFLATPVFMVGCFYFGKSALGALRAHTANMDVLILLGVLAAFLYSLTGTLFNLGPEYLFYETSATIITIVLFGNLLEHKAVRKTTSALQELGKLQATSAKRITGASGQEIIEEIDARLVKEGDLLLVNTGDRIPADGSVVFGDGLADESMVSGESLPVDKSLGSSTVGGTILTSGSIRMRATAVGEQTVLSHIVRLVREAQIKRPKIQKIGDRVSAVFVPAVALFAAGTFILSFALFGVSFQNSLMRAIAVLVVACPCAMGLATPTAVMVGLGKAARRGILVKGGDTLEQCATVTRMIFDKTGTLTTGDFKIDALDIFERDASFVKSAIVAMETHSSHPIAKSILRELQGVPPLPLKDIREVKGLGISALLPNGKQLRLGSKLLLPAPRLGYDVYLFEDETCLAAIRLSDKTKPGAKLMLEALSTRGISSVMLSGDRQEKCDSVAKELGISEYYAEQQPQDKVAILERIESNAPSAFVGDGINDAPSLARARIGISLSDATQVAIQSSQVTLMSGGLDKLPALVDISRLTLRTIKQNLFWAFFYNVLMIPLAAYGLLTPTVAAFSMAFSDVIIILNSLSLRLRKFE